MKNSKNYSFVALDIGTSNTIAYVSGAGILYNEPSIIAYNNLTNKIVSIGNEAAALVGKTYEKIRTVRPLINGVVNDMSVLKEFLIEVFNRVKLGEVWKKSIVVLSCPSGVTELEKSALKKLAYDMGSSYVLVEEQVKLAAIGSNIDINLPVGRLILSIGGGTTDIAVISAGEVVLSKSIKIAGDAINDEIERYIRSEHNVLVGKSTAEKIKINMATLIDGIQIKHKKVYGRDVITGLPREINITLDEIRSVLLPSFSRITDLLVEVLEVTPPELASDILNEGIVLCGGGTLIKGIDKYFQQIFQLKVTVNDEPTLSVINGAKQYERTPEELVERIKIIDSNEYVLK